MVEITARTELTVEQRTAVAAMVNEVRARLGRPGLGEQKQLTLALGENRATHLIAEEDGTLRGYAQLARNGAEWALEYCIAADATAEATADAIKLGTALIEAARDVALVLGIAEVELFVLRPGPEDDEIADALGLEVTREILEMRRPLPLEPGIVERASTPTRSFRVGIDEGALLAVNRAAFADHPEQGTWQTSDLTARERLEWFDADGILLAEIDGELAGFCWTKIHREPEELGEIYVVGVAPGFQGRGLGRGLVVAGLDHLASRGEQVAMLYVDGDNIPALGLYRALGFSVAHVDRIFRLSTTRR